jgi:flagellar protein FliO/FliZ
VLDELFGETGGAIAQFILALIVVLILILIVAWLLKKLGGGRFGATNSGQAELSIVDTLAIDPKRRLVLVRHGKLEHLLLIGGGSDEVVERSIVGGLPIAARVQASKPASPSPEKPPEPPARPSSKFLDRLERTNAARKSSTTASEPASTAAASDSKSTSNDLAALGASAVATEATTGRSAYATMVAATSEAERKSAAAAQREKPIDTATPSEQTPAKAEPAMVSPTPIPAPEPIDLPPLPKPSTATPPSSAPASPPPPTDVPPPPVAPPLPKSEREALEQSLDAALHDSLLTPEPSPTEKPEGSGTETEPVAASEEEPSAPTDPATTGNDASAGSADTADFKLFDDGELEREMEAALADTSQTPAPNPALAEQSTAAIEAELAIDLETPSNPAAPPLTPSTSSANLPPLPEAEASDQHGQNESDEKPEIEEPSASPATGAVAGTDDASEPQTDAQPYKDIPVELSRPDPVAIQIPSRGPAANATSVTKADNGLSTDDADADIGGGGDASEPITQGPTSPVDLSQLLDTPPSGETAAPESGETQPASGTRSDLDEEMRRLLGEIAGDPKAN